MNHGLKINGNILEITLPEEVHINRVMVNRQIFSQRMQVCKSCKYHGLEGHEEPCVSCEVGNSNYVPSVELEERTEERTETHACDLISRQKAIDTVKKMRAVCDTDSIEDYEALLETAFEVLPSAESAQNVPKDDLISRKAAIDAVTNGMCSGYDCEVIETLEYLPSAQPVRHGRFIGTEYDGYADGSHVFYEWKCSECGCIFEDEEPTYNYCPNCGAKMDEVT